MAESKGNEVRFLLEDGESLGDSVIFGFCDVSAAGCRALMSMQSSSEASVSASPLRLVGVPCKPVFSRPNAGEDDAAVLLFKISRKIKSSEDVKMSLIILNTSIPTSQCIHVARALLSLVQGNRQGSTAPALVVAAAMHVGAPAHARGLSHISLNGADLPSCSVPSTCGKLPELDPATPVPDSFLASLVHLVRATGQSCTCVIAPGHPPRGGYRPGAPGNMAVEVVDSIGQWLSHFTGLKYAPNAARELTCVSGWREEQPDGQMMYG